MRIGLLVVVGVGAAAALAVSLVSGGPALWRNAARLPLWSLIAVIVLNLASWLGEAVVFAALAGRRGVRGVARMVAVYVGGGFPALVTPFGSGGIPGWTWALTREGMSAGEAAAVVGMRALVTSVFFVVAGAVGVAVLPARAAGSTGAGLLGAGVLVLVVASVVAVASRPEIAARAADRMLGSRAVRKALGAERAGRLADGGRREALRFAEGLRALTRDRPGALAVALAGLLVSRACLLAILPVVLVGLGWRGDPLPVLVTVLGVWALASASPTPGGSGTVEAAMTAALSRIVPLETAGAAALLWRGVTFYFDLLISWVLFSRYLAKRTA